MSADAQAVEHLGVLAAHEGGAVVVGDGQVGDLVARRARLDRLEDLLHGVMLPTGSITVRAEGTVPRHGCIHRRRGSYTDREDVGRAGVVRRPPSSAALRSPRRWSDAGVTPDDVDHVIIGQVLMAGQGQVPSRQAAVKAGIPMRVPAVNVNKVCLSGLNAIYLANQMIAAGEADIVVAGGMESMTNAPYLADGARAGFRYGNTELRDAIIADGLWCAFDACLMGLGTDRYTGQLDHA